MPFSITRLFFFLMIPPPPISTLFPYTTLFRSLRRQPAEGAPRPLDGHRPAHAHPGRAHPGHRRGGEGRSEEHTSELQSHHDLVCRLLLEKKKARRSPRIKAPTR